jgi:hypothetical protein
MFTLCRWVILFHSERWTFLFLKFFVDRTFLIILRMVSSTQKTSDNTRSFFPVSLVVEWSPAHFTHLSLKWQKLLVCPYRWHLAHWAISHLCSGGSNLILHYCRYSTLKISLKDLLKPAYFADTLTKLSEVNLSLQAENVTIIVKFCDRYKKLLIAFQCCVTFFLK